MRRAFAPLVTLCSAMALILLTGCGSSAASGGGAFTIVCPDGVCPAGYVCVAAVCQYKPGGSGADTAGSDSGASQDVGQPQDTNQPQDTSAPPDVPTAKDTQPGQDATLQDADKLQDTAKVPDTQAQDDVQQPADTVASPGTIQEVQMAASSQTCAKPDAIVLTAKVSLKSVVLTGPPTKVKGKSGNNLLFYVTPSNGPKDPSWAGLQVLVLGESLTLDAGDVLDIAGDVNEYFCMTELVANPADVSIIGKVAQPLAYTVPLSALQGEGAEPYEDDLVRVQNVYVSNPNVIGSDGKAHGQFAIGPGAGTSILTVSVPFPTSYATNQVPNVQTGQKFASITGNLAYAFGAWVLKPRSDADFQP
jgi:hypothetical protein